MKASIIILLAVILTSCASNKSKHVPSKVYGLENKDFERPKPYRFIPSRDYFQNAKGGKENEALRFESSQRIDASDVDDKGVIADLVRLCQKKDFDDLTEFIRRNYDRYRDNPSFWNQVGICYMLKNDTKKALLFYNKSIDFKKDYAPAFNNLGVMYWRKGELDKAQVAFERAKNYGKFSNTPKLNLGFLFLQYQLSDKAEPLFESLYKQGPKDQDVLNGLMTSYLFNNKFSAAQKICDANEKHWENPSFGINCAKVYYFEKNFNQAKKVFNDVEDGNLGNWKNYYYETKNLLGVK